MMVWVWFCVCKVFGMLHLNMLISYEVLNPSQRPMALNCPHPTCCKFYMHTYTPSSLKGQAPCSYALGEHILNVYGYIIYLGN
jgi:hypothetical protein